MSAWVLVVTIVATLMGDGGTKTIGLVIPTSSERACQVLMTELNLENQTYFSVRAHCLETETKEFR